MRGDRYREERTALIFIAPLLIFILLFVLLPVAGTFFTSLFKDVAFLEKRFVLFGNYRGIIADRRFWASLRFTLLFTGVTVFLEMILGLSFALILNRAIPMRCMLRACVILPWAIPAAISARTWELIYNYSYGLLNFLFLKTGIAKTPVNWLGTGAGAFFSLVIADVWKTTAFVVIILLAALQAIPEDLHMQTQVDGATFIQGFYWVTLPLIRPAIIVALLFRTIDALRVFDIIFVLTNGGPGGATASLSIYGYRYFLLGDWGYGSAVSVLLFLVALALSLFYVRMGRWDVACT